MRLHYFPFIISIWLLSFSAKAQPYGPSQIMGYTWGMSYKECLKEIKQQEIKFKGSKEEEIRYKGEFGTDVRLVFERGLYQVISAKTFTKEEHKQVMEHFNSLLENLTDNHGKHHKSQVQEKEILLYEWKFIKTNILLIYYIPTHTVTLEYIRN